ncbi:hypothetical protein CC86DRAFT_404497 [Ophiobolus disseminans]|uniref:BTB domain-containing protein n=1 Tax=Ophiobolus disseminans TaxID=1469910 RepID=A0A6A7A713_9PLEO|nr:hypothetical protein CC86DRAFT_404497 [Ophiobolus disseminans]
MNNTSIQQPTPSPSHMPSLRQPAVACQKSAFRQDAPPPAPDMFLDLLQGPTVTLIFTLSPNQPQRRYTLPIALLTLHSRYFRAELARLVNEMECLGANKKRKIEDISTGDEEDVNAEKERKDKEMVMHIEHTDHAIFGLFLKFIYTGNYTVDVDAVVRPASQSPYASPVLVPVVPVSVHAWLLAQRLSSVSFMNHAIRHIYTGVGKFFALTPGMVDYVWMATMVPRCTAVKPTKKEVEKDEAVKIEKDVPPPPYSPSLSTTTTTAEVRVGNTPTPTSTPKTVYTPTSAPLPCSPLRKLLLDFLVVHWPSHTSGHVISRLPHQQGAWNALFDKHADLRRDLIFGLQGCVKMGAVEGYFVGMGVGGGVGRDDVRGVKREVVVLG